MENKKIQVSIIIATYNAASHIEDCLKSIETTYNIGYEIIIVDGESTDDTIKMVEKFNTGNLKYISEKDHGIYDALNKGIKMAEGKWLYFMGSDDRLLPGFNELIGKLNDENTIYYGNSEANFDERIPHPYELLVGKFSKYRLAKYCINHQAIIYPANAFQKYSYNLKYKVFADYALNLALWGDKNFKRAYYPITIVSYFMNGFSSVSNDILFKRDKSALIKQNLGWLIYIRFSLKKLKKRLRGELDFELES